MPAVDLSSFKQPSGTGADGTKLDNMIDQLQTTLNGLDNNNFASGKIFDPTKVMQNGAIDRQLLTWDAASATWKPVGGAVYRKSTAKQVVNTVADTDLLNGEITIGAGLLGVAGIVRLTAWGDMINNTGGAQAQPRWKLKLGGTTIFDTGAVAGDMSASVTHFPWRITAEIQNLGAANSQWCSFAVDAICANGVGAGLGGFTTGVGDYWNNPILFGIGQIRGQASNSAAIDTTAAKLLELSVINGVANAAYDTTLKSALVEVL